MIFAQNPYPGGAESIVTRVEVAAPAVFFPNGSVCDILTRLALLKSVPN